MSIESTVGRVFLTETTKDGAEKTMHVQHTYL